MKEIMNHDFNETWVNEIAGTVAEMLGKDYSVRVIDQNVNSGGRTPAIVAGPSGSSIGVILHPERYDGPVQEVAEKMVSDFKKRGEEDMKEMLMTLKDKDFVLENVKPQLVNFIKNEEQLKERPHRKFVDLAVQYRVNLDDEKSVVVTNSLAKMDGISEEELYKAAMKNLRRQEFTARGISECLGMSAVDDDPITVLTNSRLVYGANVLMRSDFLKKVADRKRDDLYLIPSSIHEVLAIPTSFGINPDELKEMVKDINSTEVSPDEVLSDTVYRYSREDGELLIA